MEKQKKEKNKQEKSRKKRRLPILSIAVVCVLAVCVLSLIFGAFQLSSLESGILDVCATQQDAYVQMVIDQINLKENRSNEEIITDILGTMDASTNKYWTFSSDQTMLFVKDVLETNKYKGFTTETYYSSDSADDFLKTLQINRVTHSNITIEGKDYVASGAAFEYGGNEYKLCLLANRSIFLDNNKYLSAKTNLQIMAIALLVILALTAMILAQKIKSLRRQLSDEKESVAVLSQGLTKMNEMYSERDLHNTGNNLWRHSSLDGFLKKLRERKAAPLTLITLKCATDEQLERLLEKAQILLDKSVLRFESGENAVTLLFVKCDLKNAELSVEPLAVDGVTIAEVLYLENESGEFCKIENNTAKKES